MIYEEVWTSRLLILSAAFLLTAAQTAGRLQGSPGFLRVFHGFGDHLAHL